MKVLEEIVNIVLRAVFGIIGIYCVNTFLQVLALDYMVGLNQWTVGAVGLLGLPGMVLLYAVRVISAL